MTSVSLQTPSPKNSNKQFKSIYSINNNYYQNYRNNSNNNKSSSFSQLSSFSDLTVDSSSNEKYQKKRASFEYKSIIQEKAKVVQVDPSKLTVFFVNDLWLDYIAVMDLEKQKNGKKKEYREYSHFYNKQGGPKSIDIEFVQNLRKISKCEKNQLIIALIYLDRIIKSSCLDPFRINYERLVSVCLMLAIKFQEDVTTLRKSKLEKLLKISNINPLELEFLCIIQYKMIVSEAEYKKFFDVIWNFFRKFVFNQAQNSHQGFFNDQQKQQYKLELQMYSIPSGTSCDSAATLSF